MSQSGWNNQNFWKPGNISSQKHEHVIDQIREMTIREEHESLHKKYEMTQGLLSSREEADSATLAMCNSFGHV